MRKNMLFGPYSRKCCAYQHLEVFPLHFLPVFQSFRSYIKVFDPLWMISVQDERKRSGLSLLHEDIQFSQHHLLKRLSILHCMFQHLCWISVWAVDAWIYFSLQELSKELLHIWV
jgi:hypothetical protein